MGPYDSTLYRSDARPLCDGSVTWDSQLHRFTASPTAYRDGVLCRRPHWSGLGRHRQTPWALSRSTRTTSSMTWRSTRSSGRANNPERRRFKTAAVRKALAELGKAVKTVFLCRYLHNQALRREVNDGLNVVEHWNSANDFIFFARSGEFSSNRRLVNLVKN
jgi:hypothetical protein